MSDWISSLNMPDGTILNIKDSAAIVSITRAGDTFTATKHDGSTFTFTQHDITISSNPSNPNIITITDNDGNTYDVDIIISDATQSNHGLMSASDKVKIDGIESGAEVNQLAFSKIRITKGSAHTDLDADTKTDTLELIEGDNITLTPSAVSDAVTIHAKDTIYTLSQDATDGHIIILTNNDESSTDHVQTLTIPDNNTTYTVSLDESTNEIVLTDSLGNTMKAKPSNASTSLDGFMSKNDKSKLDGIASGAEVNQNAFSNVAVDDVTISADTKTDTLTFIAGSNITITPNATNDSITISSSYTNTTYELTQDATDGHKFTLSGSNGYTKTITIPDNNTTYTLSVGTGTDANQIVFTPSSGSATKITVPYATKALQDADGNVIKDTYAASFSISGHTITLKNKSGVSLGTVTVPDNNTTYTFAEGTTNKAFSVTPSGGSAQTVPIHGLGSASEKNFTTSVTSGSADLVTSGAVASAISTAIDNLPEPMIFKGTLGTNGTITSLPTASSSNEGWTYKVITAGTYASQAAKVGDMFVSAKIGSAYQWVYVPSGDDVEDTWRNIKVNGTEKLGTGISSGAVDFVDGDFINITYANNKITVSHADTSSQASVSNSGRTYIQSVTLDGAGHVTKLTSATETVVNTDRYVNSASFADDTTASANSPVKMTLTRAGSDTATVTANIPKVSASSAGVAPKGASVSSQSQSTKFLREDGTWSAPSYTVNTDTKVTSVGNHYTPTADSSAQLSASASGGTAAWSIDVVQGVQLQRDAKGHVVGVTVTSGKIPGNPNTNYYHKTGSWNGLTYTAGKVGSPDDLAFTIPTGTSATTVAVGNHTHSTTIATSTGTNQLTLSHGGKYAITTGGTSFVFTMPTDNNTDTNVTQTATNTNANYEVLFSGTADNTTRTEGARKYSNLTFNPSTGTLTTTKVVSANATLGVADIDTANITEDNVGNLIVTGAARFLNTINGSISGNAATATKATQDGSGNVITSTYLKLSGGTMTGGVTFVGNQSSAWNDKGIIFSGGSRIGESSAFGIYGNGDVYIRPNSGSAVGTDGIVINASGLEPTSNNTEYLGSTTNKWNTVYATTFSGKSTSAGTADKATAANLTTTQYGITFYTNTTGTFGNNPCLITTSTGGLEIKGIIAGDTNATGHGLWGGGGYHNAYNNIILHGDASTGSSGIAFVSDKINASTGAVTNVNQPSDRAFIQYHACGITTATTEGNNPTLATSGESGKFVIGIGNDADDQIWLQTPSRTGLIHQVATGSYTIPDTGNTTGNVGSGTQPVYVSGGVITSTTYSLGKSVPSNAVFTDHTYNFSGTTFYSGNKDNSEHNANNMAYNGVYYYNSNGPASTLGATSTDGALYAEAHSTSWVGQIAQDYRNGRLFVRGKNNGTWQKWLAVLDTGNIGYIMTSTINYNPHTRTFITNKSTSAWDAQIYSQQGYIDNVFVTFRPSQTNMAIMVGLDANPSEDANYNKIDYAWYVHNDGKLTMFESGTERSSITGHTTYVAGDELRVEYSAGAIRYYHNGVECRSVTRAIGDKLFMDSSMHGATSTIYDVSFGNGVRNANYATYATSAGSATKATQDGDGNAITSTYLPLKTNSGIKTCSGNGQYGWFRIATLKITGGYVNGPVVFEVSQRQLQFTTLQVCFASNSSADPGLSYFVTNYTNNYYIKKTDTSTWELYGEYSELWGACSLHRISGFRYNNGVSVTVDMVNISEAPTGTTQAVYGGYVYYSTTSGSASTATKANSLATEVGTSAGARSVWYSYLGDNTKAVYDTAFTYNPSGGVLTATKFSGAIATPNNTYNNIGDDVAIGDINVAGTLGVKGLNGATGIQLVPYSGSTAQKISINGSGTMTITGTVASTFSGNLTGNVTGNVSGSSGSCTGNAATATKATQDSDGNTIKSTYLKLSGGTMTGTIKYNDTTGSEILQIGSNNQDTSIFRVYTSDLAYSATSAYGFTLKYLGTGSGNNNKLVLYSDNQTASTQVAAISITQDGTATFANTISGNVSGSAGKLTTNAGSATNPVYFSGGIPVACTYSLNKTVPSNAVFTDQNVNQSATTTSNWRKIVLSYQDSASAGAAVTTNTNVVYVTPNAEIQPSTGTIRTAGNLQASGSVCANVGNSSTAGGLALYGTSPTDYGIAFRGTGNGGKHGYVQGDWAQYHYMAGADNRGWVFNAGASTGVASISRAGHMVLNGSLTVGGNASNNAGMRLVWNSSTSSLDFVVA